MSDKIVSPSLCVQGKRGFTLWPEKKILVGTHSPIEQTFMSNLLLSTVKRKVQNGEIKVEDIHYTVFD